MYRFNRLNQLLSGVRILSALRNPAVIFSVVAAVGCMESPIQISSPPEEAVIATAAAAADSAKLLPRYEAEMATIIEGGAEVGSNASGYSGTGYVGFPHAAGGMVVWRPQVSVTSGNRYRLVFRYSNGSGAAAVADVIVNGKIHTLQFPKTASWGTWSTKIVTQTLGPMLHEISVNVTSQKGLNLDCVIVR